MQEKDHNCTYKQQKNFLIKKDILKKNKFFKFHLHPLLGIQCRQYLDPFLLAHLPMVVQPSPGEFFLAPAELQFRLVPKTHVLSSTPCIYWHPQTSAVAIHFAVNGTNSSSHFPFGLPNTLAYYKESNVSKSIALSGLYDMKNRSIFILRPSRDDLFLASRISNPAPDSCSFIQQRVSSNLFCEANWFKPSLLSLAAQFALSQRHHT
ncbi:hypothetical protein BpHYR1_039667 [Brachionus plicatilis]|uniref:Uncharacterized protein n=1 Tax=Brachionus plicatilis TaxID=10195 RepID=A0A3M7RRP8_BRAPC|nr:hypothetical protein BpHYR1_039667 [Brachionus plicatilis]